MPQKIIKVVAWLNVALAVVKVGLEIKKLLAKRHQLNNVE
ncbi:hypothetical protein LFAB_04175 [Lactiplantibacillus fabifermentans T30PCM01]|uniref:Uncharacterized protein n=1 Tax=Lactiplantibacillus fabifermentans T30PCM01 TaxID=1400520 RepID=W6T9A5_9LACO|nr:hypothetical protein LFAB_04175 [Lactiplantibacillus fabifermentans T30PCM01]